MNHLHGPEASISEEADPLYRAFGGLEHWATVPFDDAAWVEAVDRLRALRTEHPAWGAMVGRGMVLAAAYNSAALDGLYAADADLGVSLLRGEARLDAVDEEARAHVTANARVLELATHIDVTEDSIRRIHEVACRTQLTHQVRVDDRIQDHVLAAGDYKHHPNHVRLPTGSWQPTAPVSQVGLEMAALEEQAGSTAFGGLHPVVRAAYLHNALLHIQPFADGNGRVARALASGCLLGNASIPFLPFAGDEPTASTVDLVQGAGVALVDLLTSAAREGPALDRWRAEEAAADTVRRHLVPAIAEALARYAQRPSRRADLTAATVVAGDTIVIRVPPTVDEVITIEAHRDGPVLVTAAEAGLGLEGVPGADVDAWLDRVASTLALRVAAEVD